MVMSTKLKIITFNAALNPLHFDIHFMKDSTKGWTNLGKTGGASIRILERFNNGRLKISSLEPSWPWCDTCSRKICMLKMAIKRRFSKSHEIKNKSQLTSWITCKFWLTWANAQRPLDAIWAAAPILCRQPSMKYEVGRNIFEKQDKECKDPSLDWYDLPLKSTIHFRTLSK